MVVGDRLREVREQKKLSQGDIEKRTGLLRCYISRVENGLTVPSVSTLMKLASALGVPLWKLFHDGHGPAPRPLLTEAQTNQLSERDKEFLNALSKYVGKMAVRDRALLLKLAIDMARRQNAGR
jgi:transcriptional regulator with XRE-family HTH domain